VSAKNGAVSDSISEVGGQKIVASKRDGNLSQPHSQQAQDWQDWPLSDDTEATE